MDADINEELCYKAGSNNIHICYRNGRESINGIIMKRKKLQKIKVIFKY